MAERTCESHTEHLMSQMHRRSQVLKGNQALAQIPPLGNHKPGAAEPTGERLAFSDWRLKDARVARQRRHRRKRRRCSAGMGSVK